MKQVSVNNLYSVSPVESLMIDKLGGLIPNVLGYIQKTAGCIIHQSYWFFLTKLIYRLTKINLSVTWCFELKLKEGFLMSKFKSETQEKVSIAPMLFRGLVMAPDITTAQANFYHQMFVKIDNMIKEKLTADNADGLAKWRHDAYRYTEKTTFDWRRSSIKSSMRLMLQEIEEQLKKTLDDCLVKGNYQFEAADDETEVTHAVQP